MSRWTKKRASATQAEATPAEATPAEATPAQATEVAADEWPAEAKPSALLIPQFVRDQRNLETVKSRTIMVVAGAAALSAAAAVFTYTLAGAAADTLAATEAHKNAVQAQVTALAPVAEYYDGITLRNARTSTLMAHDVRHAELISTITRALPSSTEMSMYSTVYGAPCVTPDPFETKPVIGCIEMRLSGAAGDPARVLENLRETYAESSKPLIVDAFVVDTSENADGAQFQMTVNFTEHAYSGKYVNEQAMAEQQAIDAAAQAAAAAAAGATTTGGAQ